jgi:hypothetical protein
MSKSEKSKSEKSTPQKSTSASKPTREKDPGQLRLLLHRLEGEARLAQHQRVILPALLRAKIDCTPSLKAQSDRFIKCNALMAEALHTALDFKSLTPREKADVTQMIVRVVLSVAERKPELLSPILRATTEIYLGQTLDEYFREDLNSFELEDQTGPDVDPQLLEQFKRQVKLARSAIDLERISAETRRCFQPNCVGDLEYFAKRSQHDQHLIAKAKDALDLLNKFKNKDNRSDLENSNIPNFNSTSTKRTVDTTINLMNIVGQLDDFNADPNIGSLDKLFDRLNDEERRVLVTGLSAQTKMLNFENQLILSHPDAQPLAELVEGITELLDLEPSIRLQVMIDREIFYSQIIYDIEANRSVKKLRLLITEYLNATEG